VRLRRRFFVDGFAGGRARMSGSVAHHLGRVLRGHRGQIYELSDGTSVYMGRIDKVERDAVEFVLLDPVSITPPAVRISLLVALVKFDRFEWALEKATELGAETVVPLAAERSDKPLLAAAPKRAPRWRRILAESAQQARCLSVPELRPLARPRDAFMAASASVRVILSERPGARRLRGVLADQQTRAGPSPAAEVAMAIGPEGGWTESEFAAAAAANFVEASLGDRVLRTETAVIAGLALTHFYFDHE
jgi:16S rRNA (uracil1498-N3)-methyltransferase